MPINGGGDMREISRVDLRDTKEVKDRGKKSKEIKENINQEFINYIKPKNTFWQFKLLHTDVFAFCFHTTHTNEMIPTATVCGNLFVLNGCFSGWPFSCSIKNGKKKGPFVPLPILLHGSGPPIPSCHCMRGGVPPGQVGSITRPHRDKQDKNKHPHSHSHLDTI